MTRPKRLKPPTLAEAQVFRWIAVWFNETNIDATAFETQREARAFLRSHFPYIHGSKVFRMRVAMP